MKDIRSEIQAKMMGFFYYPYYNKSREFLGREYTMIRQLRNIDHLELLSTLSDLPKTIWYDEHN